MIEFKNKDKQALYEAYEAGYLQAIWEEATVSPLHLPSHPPSALIQHLRTLAMRYCDKHFVDDDREYWSEGEKDDE